MGWPSEQQLQARRLEADLQPPQTWLVQLADQHSADAVWFDTEISEHLRASLIQTTHPGW